MRDGIAGKENHLRRSAIGMAACRRRGTPSEDPPSARSTSAFVFSFFSLFVLFGFFEYLCSGSPGCFGQSSEREEEDPSPEPPPVDELLVQLVPVWYSGEPFQMRSILSRRVFGWCQALQELPSIGEDPPLGMSMGSVGDSIGTFQRSRGATAGDGRNQLRAGRFRPFAAVYWHKDARENARRISFPNV